jgi:nucleotide-binding universal stress UspA family protein
MKRILVPTDFSPASHNAALFAGAMARDCQASILLMNAYLEPAAIGEVPSILIATNAQLREDTEGLLEKEALRLRNLFNIQVDIAARPGFASVTIESLCEMEHPDLLVMGMKGMGASGRWMGSTTTAMVRKAHGPVMIIPEDIMYESFHNITLASDLADTTGSEHYSLLKELILRYDATVQIVHVRQRIIAGEENMVKENPGLEKLLSGIRHSYNFLTDVSVEEGLKVFLKSHPTQLLVMVAHRHNFFDRMINTIHSKAMSYETSWPLLILHDE